MMIIDPEELYAFRCQLSELSEKLMEQLRRTDAAMETVAKSGKMSSFKNIAMNLYKIVI